MNLGPQKAKREADPETSLKDKNNAPKCLFPSLADTTDTRPRWGPTGDGGGVWWRANSKLSGGEA